MEKMPSLTKQELIVSPPTEYPFEHVAADFFYLNGHHYLVYADRYTGWIELAYYRTTPNSSDIIKTLRDWFHHFGIPSEISIDGGPKMSSKEIESFLKKWGVRSRLSSAYYPKSNGRAEAGVKTMKRMIEGNTGPQGSINNDKIVKALLQYRNTPLKNANKSPAQLLLGRQLKDCIPQPKTVYQISPHWQSFMRNREKTLAEDKLRSKTYHDNHQIKRYDPLTVGQHVACQNMRNKKWDRIGSITEARNFRQYLVRMDGSGRISLRNRIHLKPLLHIRPHLPVPIINDKQLGSPVVPVPSDSQPETNNSSSSCKSQSNGESTAESSSNSRSHKEGIVEPSTVEQRVIPRRSTRANFGTEPQRYGKSTT